MTEYKWVDVEFSDDSLFGYADPERRRAMGERGRCLLVPVFDRDYMMDETGKLYRRLSARHAHEVCAGEDDT